MKNLGPCVQILDRKPERVKFDEIQIVRSKFASRDGIFYNVRNNENLVFGKGRVRHVQSRLTGVGDRQSGDVVDRDKGRKREGLARVEITGIRGHMASGARVHHPITEAKCLEREMLFMAAMSLVGSQEDEAL